MEPRGRIREAQELGVVRLKRAVRKTQRAVEGALRRLPVTLEDRRRNRWCRGTEPRFLVARFVGRNPRFYDVILEWLEQTLPEVRARFELHLLPVRVRDGARYALHLPWVQDPLERWSRRAYAQALRLAEDCDARGIPIVNRVDRLANAGKSAAAQRIGELGIRTPRTARITDPAAFRETRLGVPLPLFVREDWGHGGRMLRADTPDEARALPLHRFERPVAIEIVDVCGPDGLYRKYRYVAAGDTGIAHSLHVSDHWITRGSDCLYSEALREEELAYTGRPDPNHEALQRARRALGFDFVAFDYGYDRDGRLVVWEPNPYPYLHFARGRRLYRARAVERTLAAIVRLYLERAKLPVPARLDDILAQ